MDKEPGGIRSEVVKWENGERVTFAEHICILSRKKVNYQVQEQQQQRCAIMNKCRIPNERTEQKTPNTVVLSRTTHNCFQLTYNT